MLNRLFRDRRPLAPPPSRVDTGTLIFGTLFGLLIGGIATLLNVPYSGASLRARIAGRFRGAREGMIFDPRVPMHLATRDPVQRSIDEGKQAARRLQDAL